MNGFAISMNRTYNDSLTAQSIYVRLTRFDAYEFIQKLQRLNKISELSIDFKDCSFISETNLANLEIIHFYNFIAVRTQIQYFI